MSIIKASKKSPHVIRYFGLSKNPATNNYIIVMEYANQGNLHKYLVNNYITLTWEKKLEILNFIISGLQQIHMKGLVHGALHSGNLLVKQQDKSNNQHFYFSDLGFSRPIDVKDDMIQ
ncbi:15490_t:CDS:1, partial [Racocetra fulgida]